MENRLWTQELYSLPSGHLHVIIDPEMSDETCGEYLITCDHPFTAEVCHRYESASPLRVKHPVTPAQYAQALLDGRYQEEAADRAANLAQLYWMHLEVREDTTVLIRCPHSEVWGDWEQVWICGSAIWMRESDEIDADGHPYHWISYELAREEGMV